MRGLLILTAPLAILLIIVSYNPIILEGMDSAGKSENSGLNSLSFISIIGGLFVFAFYKMKFSRWPGPNASPAGFLPHPTGHFTTWLRYTIWSFVYASSMTMLYMIIILFPKAFINLFQIMAEKVISASTGADLGIFDKIASQVNLSEQFYDPNVLVPFAVIVVTFVWAGAFGKHERKFRSTIQEAALIPNEAQRLISILEEDASAFKPDTECQNIVIKQSKKNGIILNNRDFSPSNGSSIFKYTQSLYIDLKINTLKKDTDFSKIIERYKHDIENHKNYLHSLTDRWANYKKALCELIAYILNRRKPANPKNKIDAEKLMSMPISKIEKIKFKIEKNIPSFLNEYFNEEKLYLDKSSGQCLKNLLQIVVCGVLALGKMPIKRRYLLEKVSYFVSKEFGLNVNRNYIAMVIITLSVIVFLGTLVLILINHFFGIHLGNDGIILKKLVPQGPGTIGLWTVYTLMMHLIAIFCGFLIIKTSTQQSEESENTGFPFADLTECFIFGFSLSTILLVVLNFPYFPYYKWQQIAESWAWSFVPAITASFAGFYFTETCLLAKPKTAYSILQGAITSFASLTIIVLIYDQYIFLSPSPIPKELISFSVYSLILSFLIGFALSHIIQSWVCNQKG
jgi:hypothetical protein